MDSEAALQPAGATGPPRRIAVNAGYLLVAYVIESAFSFLLLLVVARYLDQAGFGRYGYVISFVELLIMITELANSRVQVREMAADLPGAAKPLSDIWSMRIGLSIVMLVVTAAAATVTGADREVWLCVMLFAVGQVFFVLAEVFNATFRAYQQMRFQTYTVVLGQLLITALCIGAILLDLGLVGLFAARVVANFIRLIYAWYLSRSRFLREHISTDWRQMFWLLKESLPLGINLILRRLIWRGGIILTTISLNRQEPGLGDLTSGLLYGPIRLVEQMRIVPTALVGALLPVYSQQARFQPLRFRRTLAESHRLLVAMSLLLTVVFVTLAVPITVVTLGLDLAASAPILALLAWSIPLSFANQLYESALLAVGRQGIAAVGLATGFVISLAASWFYLIPHHQAMGVAWGIILAEAVALVFCLGGLLPYFDKRRLLVNGCQFAAATGAALGAAYLLRDQPDWLAGGVAIVTFIVVVLASGTFSAKELEAATTMLTFDKRLRWIRHRIFGAHAGSAPESPTGGAEPHHD